MKILVLGGSGATGRRLILELLSRGHEVTAVVRSSERFVGLTTPEWSERIHVVEASILELGRTEIENLVEQCDGIGLCLGHNLTFKGLFGKPRHLVTDAVKRICDAAVTIKPEGQMKLVLMNTTANQNRGVEEHRKSAEKVLLRILRYVLPPHKDNEDAAEYLRSQIGPDHKSVGWVAVRPDTLTNEPRVSEYSVHSSPTRSPLFDPGKTSRANVAHFMADLLEKNDHFVSWSGMMPVLYNV